MRNYNKWSKASKVYSNAKNTPNKCMDNNFVVLKSWETLFPSEAYRPRPIINNILKKKKKKKLYSPIFYKFG